MIKTRKTYTKKLIRSLSLVSLFLASSVVSIMVLELVLRVLFPGRYRPHWSATGGLYRPDKELIYSLKPNSQRTWETEEFVEKVQINSIGLRDFEILPKKEKLRILVLGDSFTFGHGVSLENSLPKQLERLIKDYYSGEVEIINAGVKGYNFDQEYRFFTSRLLGLEQDLLIVTLGEGDFSWSCDLPLYDFIDGQLISLDATKTWIYRQLSLYNRAPYWLKQSSLFHYFLQSLEGKNLNTISLQKRGSNWRIHCQEWSFKKSVKELGELRKLGIQGGFQLLVVFAPFHEGRELLKLAEFKKMLEGNNFHFVDVNEKPPTLVGVEMHKVLGMEVINWQKLRYRLDGHLTPEGNGVFAQLVLGYMIAERMLN